MNPQIFMSSEYYLWYPFQLLYRIKQSLPAPPCPIFSIYCTERFWSCRKFNISKKERNKNYSDKSNIRESLTNNVAQSWPKFIMQSSIPVWVLTENSLKALPEYWKIACTAMHRFLLSGLWLTYIFRYLDDFFHSQTHTRLAENNNTFGKSLSGWYYSP